MGSVKRTRDTHRTAGTPEAGSAEIKGCGHSALRTVGELLGSGSVPTSECPEVSPGQLGYLPVRGPDIKGGF